MNNQKRTGQNERSRANLKRFGIEKPAIPGPGRPRLPEGLKADLKEAKKILSDYSAFAAERLVQLACSPFGNIAIQACKGILEKTIPSLEEVHDDRPLQQFTDEQLNTKLAELRSSRNGNHERTGVQA